MATDSSNNGNNNRHHQHHHHGVRAVATTTTDPRRNEKRAVAARGAAGALALSVLAVVLQSAATATPAWGYFTNPDAGTAAEKGYFGPWRQCKFLLYGRERCGQGVSRFQPVLAVWVAGLAAAAASTLLAILVGLAVLQLAMASSAKKVVISYSTALIGKVALATLATSLAIVAASLFALQTDDRANSFVVSRGEAFYMQIKYIEYLDEYVIARVEILKRLKVRRVHDRRSIKWLKGHLILTEEDDEDNDEDDDEDDDNDDSFAGVL
ncbi:hypothetical protein HZH68_012416 [Vespula germanica]|uniref:Uncharacterized protein n=1 Tax=Vespula germanica TaxID=30212 RepID=A0A834MYJ0_VESGE|nr:hypothetical protein HZH68_012416 [Vespula germanica]